MQKVWRNGCFAGQFCDPYIQNTDLEGGLTGPSLDTIVEIIEDGIKKRRDDLSTFTTAELSKLRSKVLSKLTLAAQWEEKKNAVKGEQYGGFDAFIKEWMSLLRGLEDGERIMLTGGWSDKTGGHAITHVAERVGQDYAFVSCNTGEGMEHHPSTIVMDDVSGAGPKVKFLTSMRIPNIPSERFLDEAVWYMFFKLTTTVRRENTAATFYQVILPHLAGDYLTNAVDYDGSGHYADPQLSGTCFFQCVVTAMSYLLKAEGFSELQEKELRFVMALSFLDRARADLSSLTAANEFEASDRAMITMACNETSMSAVRLFEAGTLSSVRLQKTKEQVDELMHLLSGIATQEARDVLSCNLDMEPSVPLVPYHGFSLLADISDTEPLAGGPTEASPEVFVDLDVSTRPPAQTSGPVSSTEKKEGVLCFSDVASVIEQCRLMCDKLRFKTSCTAVSLAIHQICALVEHVFSEIAPIPIPRGQKRAGKKCLYAATNVKLEEQRRVLANLQDIAFHYMSALFSITTDRAQDACAAIIMMSVTAIFDAVVRIRAVDDPSALSDVLNGARGDGSAHARDGYWLALGTFRDGHTISELSDAFLLHNPSLLLARDAVTKYFSESDMASATQKRLFGLRTEAQQASPMFLGQRAPSFTVGERDDNFTFVQDLLKKLDIADDMPPRNRRENAWTGSSYSMKHTSDAERRARWFCGEFEQAPEFHMLRDVTFLCKIALTGTVTFAVANEDLFTKKSLWFCSHIRPVWVFAKTNSEKTAALLDVRFGDTTTGLRLDGCVPTSPVAVARGPFTTEERILQAQELSIAGLPDGTLSHEETERLLCYLTVPYLAVHLVLDFFAEQRVAVLAVPKLRSILESVLFEPRAYRADVVPIKSVPVHQERRDKMLGTRYGVLMYEVLNAPDGVLKPLLTLLKSAIALCIGDYKSSFVDLFLFVLRVAVRVESFFLYVRETPALRSEYYPSDKTEELLRSMSTFLCVQAQSQLGKWLVESDLAEDTEAGTSFYAHLAVLHANARSGAEGTLSVKDVGTFMAASAYVVSWHSHSFGAKVLGESRRTVKEADLVRLMHEGKRDEVARLAMKMQEEQSAYGKASEAGMSLSVPIHDVFTAMQRLRSLVVSWSDKATDHEIDTVLGRVVSCALQKENPYSSDTALSWRGWKPITDKPIMCEYAVESPHDYHPSTEMHETVSFPGAPYILIYFDARCSTEEEEDCVTIYKDSTCTDRWGERSYSGKRGQVKWPGADGQPPLAVPADSFHVVFKSDATSEDWGFRLVASAPVDIERARTLTTESFDGKSFPIEVCQAALAESFNDLDFARNLLLNNGKTMEMKISQLEAEKQLLSKQPKGLYQDPSGEVQVNLQTGEVFLRSRTMMPVPPDIASLDDYKAVFGVGSADLCFVKSNDANRRHIRVIGSSSQFDIVAWRPLLYDETKSRIQQQDKEPEAARSVGGHVSAGLGASGVLGGLPEQGCINMPRRGPGGTMIFCGTVYDDYEAGTQGWVSELLDPLIRDSVETAKLDEVPVLWVARSSQQKAAAHAGAVGPPLCNRLLMYLEAQGDLEELKGHPGGFFEIHALADRRVLHVFALVELGRRLQRSLVFTTDCRFTLRDLSPAHERNEPWIQGCRNAAGNMFDTVMSSDGRLIARAGAGELSALNVGSVVITRPRAYQAKEEEKERVPECADEWDLEVFIPVRVLLGLVPEALLTSYVFWRTGPRIVRGYPRDGVSETEAETSISIVLTGQVFITSVNGSVVAIDVDPSETSRGVLQRCRGMDAIPSDTTTDANGHPLDVAKPIGESASVEWTAIIRRQPYLPGEDDANDEGDEAGEAANETGAHTGSLVLLNLLRTPELSTSGDERGNVAKRMAALLAPMEALSHVLVWSESDARCAGEECEVSRVELPRLRTAFSLRIDKDGEAHLDSVDYAGLSVVNRPDEAILAHAGGIPHFLVLQNNVGEMFLMIPNFSAARVNVKHCPLSTDIVLDRSPEWSNNVRTRLYVYPIHLSRAFCTAPSLSAAFYLTFLRLLQRQYKAAAPLIAACTTDMPFTPEEVWVMSLVKRTEDDWHPDAYACRLRLAIVCGASGEEVPWDFKKDAEGYYKKLSYVSAACRLNVDDEQQLAAMGAVSDKRQAYLAAVGRCATDDVKLEVAPEAISVGGSKWAEFLREVPDALTPLKTGYFPRFRYERPVDSELVGDGVYALIDEIFDDKLHGLNSGRGFLMLYEMLTGAINVSMAEDRVGIRELACSQCGLPCSMDLAKCDTCGAQVGAGDSSSIRQSSCFTLAKLTTQAMFLHLADSGQEKNSLEEEDKAFLALLAPLVEAGKLDFVGTGSGDFRYPVFPFASNPEVMADQGVKVPEGPGELKGWSDAAVSGAVSFTSQPLWAQLVDGAKSACQRATKRAAVSLVVPKGSTLQARTEPRDCACDHRVLQPVEESALGGNHACLTLLPKDIEAFATSPLSVLDLDSYVHQVKSSTKLLDSLPFSLDTASHSKAASRIMERMEQDLSGSADSEKSASRYQLRCLDDTRLADLRADVGLVSTATPMETSDFPEVGAGFSAEGTKILSRAHESLSKLLTELRNLRDSEASLVAEGTVAIEELLASTNTEGDDDGSRLAFLMRREAGQRVKVWFELAAASLLSSEQGQDLKIVNPYLTDAQIATASKALVGVLLRSVRLSQVNRCIVDVLGLLDHLKKLVVRRLEVGWPSDLPQPSHMIVNRALEIAGLDEDTAREVSVKLSRTLAALSKECKNNDAAYVAFHLADLDIDGARDILKDSKRAEALLDLARRKCFDGAGHKLSAPGGRVNVEPVSMSSMVHVLEHTAKSVASGLTAKRGFVERGEELSMDPRFLVFEYMVAFMLRPRQVELVRDFAAAAREGRSEVHQMIMGAGKTTVVGPILALMLANGKSLVTQVVPKALLEMSRSVLRSAFSNVVHKRVYTLMFDRSSADSSDPEALAKLYAKLDRARAQRAVVVTTPEAVKSLLLKYVDLLQSIEAASPLLNVPKTSLSAYPSNKYSSDIASEECKRAVALAGSYHSNAVAADTLNSIIGLWRAEQEGVALLDEVDMLLHPLRSELNFPIGEREQLDLSPHRWNLAIHLLDGVFYAQDRVVSMGVHLTGAHLRVLDDITTALALGVQTTAMQSSPHPVLLSEAFYQRELLPLVGKWVIVWVEQQASVKADFSASDAAGLFATVEASTPTPSSRGGDFPSLPASSPKDAGLAVAAYSFVCGDTSAATLETVKSCCSDQSIKVLNLARDWVCTFLPHVLGKICRVGFGLLHKNDVERWSRSEGKKVQLGASRLLLSVPFIGKDVPSRNSEFACPEVLIGLTVLAYRYEGLRASDLVTIITAMKKQLQTEKGLMVERPTRRKFDAWVATSRARSNVTSSSAPGILPLELFQPEDTVQLKALLDVLAKSPEVVTYYLQEHVFDKVLRHQRKKLQASGVDLGSDMLFGVRLGFSGTPSDLLPSQLKPCHYEPGSEAAVVRLLTSPTDVSWGKLSKWNVEVLLEYVSQHEPPFSALIDTGALVTGMTNEQVARELLRRGLKNYDACAFLDADDRKRVVDRSGGSAVELARSGVALSKRFTFYDQVHTTGMDIKQALDACAAVTLGKDMTLRDYSQGCYRMRGLGRGQTLHVIVVDEMESLIRSVSDTGDMLRDVIAWLVSNSLKSEELQYLALAQQQLTATWRQQAFLKLLSSQAPDQESIPTFLRSRFYPEPIKDVDKISAIVKQYTLTTDKDRAKIKEHVRRISAARKVYKQLETHLARTSRTGALEPFDNILERQQGDPLSVIMGLRHVGGRLGVNLVVPDLSEDDEEEGPEFDYSIPFQCPRCTRLNEDGGRRCITCGIARDIVAERKATEEALRVAAETNKYPLTLIVRRPEKEDEQTTVIASGPGMLVEDLRAAAKAAAGLPEGAELRLQVDGSDVDDMMFGHAQTLVSVGLGERDATVVAMLGASIVNSSVSLLSPSTPKESTGFPSLDMLSPSSPKMSTMMTPHFFFTETTPAVLRECVEVFREPLAHDISSVVPEPQRFSAVLRKLREDNKAFLDPEADLAAAAIITEVEAEEERKVTEDGETELSLDTEMVTTKEKEQEEEVEVEVHKPSGAGFGAIPECAVRWEVSRLADSKSLAPMVFHPLADFKATQSTGCLPYPRCILLSENHAQRDVPGEQARRLRNVYCLLDWRPQDTDIGEGVEAAGGRFFVALSLTEAETLRRVVDLCQGQPAPGALASVVTVGGVVFGSGRRGAVGLLVDPEEMTIKEMQEYLEQRDVDMFDCLTRADITALVSSTAATEASTAAAASEASAAAKAADPSIDDPVVSTYRTLLETAGMATPLACDRAVEMASQEGAGSSNNITTLEDACQTLRFFDNQLWFTEDEAISVLRGLREASITDRSETFARLMGCRIRDRTTWEGTGVSAVFAHTSEDQLTRTRKMALELAAAANTKFDGGLSEVAATFDANGDGWLSEADLERAITALLDGKLEPSDVKDLVHYADRRRTGIIRYADFLERFNFVGKEDDGVADIVKKAPVKRTNLAADFARLKEEAACDVRAEEEEEEETGGRMSYAQLQAIGRLSILSRGAVTVNGDGRVSTSSGGLVSIAPRGVHLKAGASGPESWFLELTVVSAGRATLGWVDERFDGHLCGVGDVHGSCGVTSSGLTKHNGNEGTWGELSWEIGDVIGAMATVSGNECTLNFSLNGQWDDAKGIKTTLQGSLAPAVTFDSDFVFELNMGEFEFRHGPPVCDAPVRSVRHWIRSFVQHIHILKSGRRFGRLQATTGNSQMETKDDGTLVVEVRNRFGEHIFPTCVLQGCLLTTGKWYYEFTMVKTSEHYIAQVGWADLDFVGMAREGNGCGDDKHSWGYDGSRVYLWFNGYHEFGQRWHNGDVIGCAVDVDDRTMRFSHNGDWSPPMGVAAENIALVGGLSPCITLGNFCSLRPNFGAEEFAHSPPAGYASVQSWLEQHDPSASTPPVAPPALARTPSSTSLAAEAPRFVGSSGRKALRIEASDSLVILRATGDNFPTAVAKNVSITSGTYYYEVKVDKMTEETLASIGFGNHHFFGGYPHNGVGDDTLSCGLVASESTANGTTKIFGGAWECDAVLGCLADVDNEVVSFCVNGIWTEPVRLKCTGGLSPAVSLNKHIRCRANLAASDPPEAVRVPEPAPEDTPKSSSTGDTTQPEKPSVPAIISTPVVTQEDHSGVGVVTYVGAAVVVSIAAYAAYRRWGGAGAST